MTSVFIVAAPHSGAGKTTVTIGLADDIVYDALVDRRVLDLCRDGAELISAGKRGGRPSPQQRDINEVLIERARAGRRVLRLKGGDPFVFGRGWDEAFALTQAGIRFRIIPGLTAGLAGAALAGIPATSRDTNHAVVLAAGHRAEEGGSAADWISAAGVSGDRPPCCSDVVISASCDIGM